MVTSKVVFSSIENITTGRESCHDRERAKRPLSVWENQTENCDAHKIHTNTKRQLKR